MGAPGIARLGNVLVRVALVFGVDVQRTDQPLFPEVALGLELTLQFRQANVDDSDWDSPIQRRGGATDDDASMYRRRPQLGGGGWPFSTGPAAGFCARRMAGGSGNPGADPVEWRRRGPLRFS